MLQSLHIKNLALIREEEIEFSDGLNILTGETGAGKSVVIGSVNLALGARADAGVIRTGEESALIELVFSLNESQMKAVRAMDLPTEEDGTLLITRRISQGRSVSRVNGETVTIRELKALAEILIDIHGQNDQQALLNPASQKELLDEFCGETLAQELTRMGEQHREWQDTQKRLAETEIDGAARTREADLLRYEIEEIESADLKEGEEAELERDYRRMTNAKKIGDAVGAASHVLGGDSGSGNLADALGHARRELSQVAGDDESVGDLIRQIDDMDALLSDLSRSMRAVEDGLVFDQETFFRTEERLNQLHRLQDKYGDDVAAIKRAAKERTERLSFLENMEEERAAALERVEQLTQQMRETCGRITEIRRKGAEELAEKIRSSLVDCNFLDVRFVIVVESHEDQFAADGWDTVRFDIQTNPGEAMRPISQIASGGELSRIMLGIRTVFAERDDIDTLIFDEIDAGISGRTAWRVSEKLGTLADRRQIICITHLPQIAAMADHHYGIEKGLENDRTLTKIRPLNEEESLKELARLLSADQVTEEVLSNAGQLREQARAEKETRRKSGGKKRKKK
ncbi:MAG: DNA repair protein RecN [Lachnospiraceae bacterium]|nr:DNA repair protein RecN [Lachnospiraceae bacterium]